MRHRFLCCLLRHFSPVCADMNSHSRCLCTRLCCTLRVQHGSAIASTVSTSVTVERSAYINVGTVARRGSGRCLPLPRFADACRPPPRGTPSALPSALPHPLCSRAVLIRYAGAYGAFCGQKAWRGLCGTPSPPAGIFITGVIRDFHACLILSCRVNGRTPMAGRKTDLKQHISPLSLLVTESGTALYRTVRAEPGKRTDGLWTCGWAGRVAFSAVSPVWRRMRDRALRDAVASCLRLSYLAFSPLLCGVTPSLACASQLTCLYYLRRDVGDGEGRRVLALRAVCRGCDAKAVRVPRRHACTCCTR